MHSPGYFEGMRGLLADLKALGALAAKRFAGLARRLRRWQLSLDAVLTTWLVCLFTAGPLAPAVKGELLGFVSQGGRPALLRLVLLGLKELERATSSRQSLEELAESLRTAERCFERADWRARAERVALPAVLIQSPPGFFVLSVPLSLREGLRPLHFTAQRQFAPRVELPPTRLVVDQPLTSEAEGV